MSGCFYQSRLLSRPPMAGFALVICLLVAGCKGLIDILPRYSDNRIESLQIVATEDVNQSTPVAVDLVYIFDESLVTLIEKITARQWFTEKTMYQLQYPGKLTIFNFEFIPISRVVFVPEKQKKQFPEAYQKAYKVMLYANYLKESPDYTLDITPFKQPLLTLNKSAVEVKERKK